MRFVRDICILVSFAHLLLHTDEDSKGPEARVTVGSDDDLPFSTRHGFKSNTLVYVLKSDKK